MLYYLKTCFLSELVDFCSTKIGSVGENALPLPRMLCASGGGGLRPAHLLNFPQAPGPVCVPNTSFVHTLWP